MLIVVNTVNKKYTVLILPDGFPQTQDVVTLLYCNSDRPATEEVRGVTFHWVFNKKSQQVL